MVDSMKKLCAERGVTPYNYLCAAVLGAFSLFYPTGKKDTASLSHMVDLFPFSKYHRERIKYFSTAVGFVCNLMDFVGGEIGDVWANASKVGLDLKKAIDRGEYVDFTDMMEEGGWFHKSKFLHRMYGHVSVLSLQFSFIGEIPEVAEDTPWEVEDFAWTMNYNTLCAAISIVWGYTPSGNLVTNISSNDGKMQLEELREFGAVVQGLITHPLGERGARI